MSSRVVFQDELNHQQAPKTTSTDDSSVRSGCQMKRPGRKHGTRKKNRTRQAPLKPSQFSSLKEEVQNEELEILGEIPDWIDGSYYKNGPALFEIGQDRFSHWLDGQGMIHSFKFKDGKITYSNKFLQSSNFKRHTQAGKIAVSEFGTEPSQTLMGRFGSVFKRPEEYQNANVNIKMVAGKLLALTEMPFQMEICPLTLETLSPVRYQDSHPIGHLVSSHPHTMKDGTVINVATIFDTPSAFYHIYAIKPGMPIGKSWNGDTLFKRETICKIPVKQPSYIHSFCVTENFIILVECPWVFSVSSMLGDQFKRIFLGKTITPLTMFKWMPNLGTNFLVVHRATGKVIAKYPTPAFFTHHTINAFECPEQQNKIVIDLSTHSSPNFQLDMSRLKKLRNPKPKHSVDSDHREEFLGHTKIGHNKLHKVSHNSTDFDDSESQASSYLTTSTSGSTASSFFHNSLQNSSQIRRYFIDLTRNPGEPQSVSFRTLYHGTCEYPVINYENYNTRDGYKYVYGITQISDGSLVKINIETGRYQFWRQAGVSPSEPTFIAHPNADRADDGIVCSICYDSERHASFLLILDGKTFWPIAKAFVKHHIPASLHGAFYSSDKINGF